MAKALGKEKKLVQWRKTLTDNTSSALVSVGPTACQLALVALDSWRKSTPPLREHQLRLSWNPKGTRELGEVLSSLLLAGSISQESAGAPILQTHEAAGRGVLCPTGSFGGYLPSSKDLHPHSTIATGKPELAHCVWVQAVVVNSPSRHSPTPKSTGTSGDQVKIRPLNPYHKAGCWGDTFLLIACGISRKLMGSQDICRSPPTIRHQRRMQTGAPPPCCCFHASGNWVRSLDFHPVCQQQLVPHTHSIRVKESSLRAGDWRKGFF